MNEEDTLTVIDEFCVQGNEHLDILNSFVKFQLKKQKLDNVPYLDLLANINHEKYIEQIFTEDNEIRYPEWFTKKVFSSKLNKQKTGGL